MDPMTQTRGHNCQSRIINVAKTIDADFPALHWLLAISAVEPILHENPTTPKVLVGSVNALRP